MNVQFRKPEKVVQNLRGLVSVESSAFAQFCVTSKIAVEKVSRGLTFLLQIGIGTYRFCLNILTAVSTSRNHHFII